MIRRSAPLKRSWIKRKPRARKVSWRSGKIREDAQGMALLRWCVFNRSLNRHRNQCENLLESGRRCLNFLTWETFHLHHIISRGRGGSDTEENCMALCPGCHFDTHNGTWKASRAND